MMEPLSSIPLGSEEVPNSVCPVGVDPNLWNTWQDAEAIKNDQFLHQLKRGMQGQNVGLDNGLTGVNKYIYGTHKSRYY
jgi:hypothetical protein